MDVNKVNVHVMYIEHVQYWVECVCMGLSERSVPRLIPLSAAFRTEQDRPAATDHYTPLTPRALQQLMALYTRKLIRSIRVPNR